MDIIDMNKMAEKKFNFVPKKNQPYRVKGCIIIPESRWLQFKKECMQDAFNCCESAVEKNFNEIWLEAKELIK